MGAQSISGRLRRRCRYFWKCNSHLIWLIVHFNEAYHCSINAIFSASSTAILHRKTWEPHSHRGALSHPEVSQLLMLSQVWPPQCFLVTEWFSSPNASIVTQSPRLAQPSWLCYSHSGKSAEASRRASHRDDHQPVVWMDVCMSIAGVSDTQSEAECKHRKVW